MKKYILFIVEGDHDKGELSALFSTPRFTDFKSKYVPVFCKYNGDATTNRSNKGFAIKEDISRLITKTRKMQNNDLHLNLSLSDIKEVVQVVDLDGAFIPDGRILYDSAVSSKFVYLVFIFEWEL